MQACLPAGIRRVLLKGHRRIIAASAFGRTGAAIFILLIISDIFEKKRIAPERSQLYEELYEAPAYILILIAAFTIRFLGIPEPGAVKASPEKVI